MSAWNIGQLVNPSSAYEPKTAFDKDLRSELGEQAEAAWEIYAKFAGHGIGLDAFVLLATALRQRDRAIAVTTAIKKLTEMWAEDIEDKIPPRGEMINLDMETLANCFLMADLAVVRCS